MILRWGIACYCQPLCRAAARRGLDCLSSFRPALGLSPNAAPNASPERAQRRAASSQNSQAIDFANVFICRKIAGQREKTGLS